MKSSPGTILSLLALALGGALAPDGAEAQTGRLRGTVVDARTGAPVEGAVARVDDRSTGAAADGRFELCRLPEGEVTVRVTAGGFQAVDTVVWIDSAASRELPVALHVEPPDTSGLIVIREFRGIPPHHAVFVVDGVRVFYSASGCVEPPPGVPVLEHIDRDEIESIEILKGPAAVERYGPDAAYGAVLITTRRARAEEP